MTKATFTEVSKEEQRLFLEQYPKKLEANINAIHEPPLKTYNDFTLGNWPESIVAKTMMDWLSPTGEVCKDDTHWRYFIKSGESE